MTLKCAHVIIFFMKENESNNDINISNPNTTDPADQNEASKGTWLSHLIENITHLGFGEIALRFGTNILAIGFVLLVVWLMRGVYAQLIALPEDITGAPPTIEPIVSTIPLPLPTESLENGIFRDISVHTSIPSRPRIEVIQYTVQQGDTLFGIAEKYGLNPSTILFGNYNTLKDTPHSLRPDQVLNILPIDGTYYEWQGTENLERVAEFFGVDADSIINYPGNHLDPDTIGDLANPKIQTGAWLIIPGGKREFISWSAPIGVTRDNPAVARVMGEGSCGSITGGAVGFGTFVWPTNAHYLSGYDYSPETNHRGIDLAGNTGDPIYATDAGVIVYAGWNDYGYGYMIMIDHGNGWQSLYAHLSALNVVCGQSVGQGEVVAAMGSTGNSTGSHLHFELMNTVYGKVDPKFYFPPP